MHILPVMLSILPFHVESCLPIAEWSIPVMWGSSRLIPTTKLLWKLIFNSEHNSNHLRICLTACSDCKLTGINTRVPLQMSDTFSISHLNTIEKSSNWTLWKRTESPFTAVSNNRGDKGSPCRIPQLTLNSFDGDPLIKIGNYEVWGRETFIKKKTLLHLLLNPIYPIISSK